MPRRELNGDKSQYNYHNSSNKATDNSRDRYKDSYQDGYSNHGSSGYDDYSRNNKYGEPSTFTVKSYASNDASSKYKSPAYSENDRQYHSRSGQSEYSDQEELYQDDEDDAFDALSKMKNQNDVFINNAEVVGVDEKGSAVDYIINVTYSDGVIDVIRREYSEIYRMNVAIVKEFSDEAGRDGEPRLIPFLAQTPLSSPQGTRQDLSRFFNEFFSLPDAVLDSSIVMSFFKVRRGDDANAKKYYDVADTLLSLLDDVKLSNDLTIKLVAGSDIAVIKETDDITFDEFLGLAESKLRIQIRDLLFLDECDNLVPLYDDEDFALIKALRKFKIFLE